MYVYVCVNPNLHFVATKEQSLQVRKRKKVRQISQPVKEGVYIEGARQREDDEMALLEEVGGVPHSPVLLHCQDLQLSQVR